MIIQPHFSHEWMKMPTPIFFLSFQLYSCSCWWRHSISSPWTLQTSLHTYWYFKSFELSSVTIKLPHSNLALYNIYRPPQSTTQSGITSKLGQSKAGRSKAGQSKPVYLKPYVSQSEGQRGEEGTPFLFPTPPSLPLSAFCERHRGERERAREGGIGGEKKGEVMEVSGRDRSVKGEGRWWKYMRGQLISIVNCPSHIISLPPLPTSPSPTYFHSLSPIYLPTPSIPLSASHSPSSLPSLPLSLLPLPFHLSLPLPLPVPLSPLPSPLHASPSLLSTPLSPSLPAPPPSPLSASFSPRAPSSSLPLPLCVLWEA